MRLILKVHSPNELGGFINETAEVSVRCITGAFHPKQVQSSRLKPRLHKRFFACAGDAIFSNFVESPAGEGGYRSDKF